MSAEIMAMLASRWGCSIQAVRERLTAKLIAKGLVPNVPSTIRGYETGDSWARYITLGVTDDDRVAVLDKHDNVLLWLD